jgi:hypothetical protein
MWRRYRFTARKRDRLFSSRAQAPTRKIDATAERIKVVQRL